MLVIQNCWKINAENSNGKESFSRVGETREENMVHQCINQESSTNINGTQHQIDDKEF